MRPTFSRIAIATSLLLLPGCTRVALDHIAPVAIARQDTPHPGVNASVGIDRIDQRGPNHDRFYFYERTGMGINVYVIDTGVNVHNNDFGGRASTIFDFQRPASHPDFGKPNDEHGTDVASQVGGRSFGVAKNATIYSVRVRDEGVFPPAGTANDLLNGVRAARAHINAHGQKRSVVTLSVIQKCNCSGCGTACTNLEAELRAMRNEGVVIVAGTNNQRESSFDWTPCRLALSASDGHGIICVGGTELVDNGVEFDDSAYVNSGSPVEIRAPAGHDGPTADLSWYQRGLSHEGIYGQGGFLRGNSMAAPLVAGAAALYLETKANLTLAEQPTPLEVENALKDNASNIVSGRMLYTGCEFLPPYPDNPIRDNRRFVRQHYLEFLGRQPDDGGINYWLGQINNDPACQVDLDGCFGRVNTSRAFFESIENRETNFFAYRVHRATFTTFPREGGAVFAFPNPRMEPLFRDGRILARNLIVGSPGWQQVILNNQNAYLQSWVNTPAFLAQFPAGMEGQAFAQRMYNNAQVPMDSVGIDAGNRLNAGSPRWEVLRQIVTGPSFSSDDHNQFPVTVQKLWNPMYVLLCYMGYLRRNPDDAPDTNIDGFLFWLNILNQQTFAGGNPGLARHEMIRAFLVSNEYKDRFQKGPHCQQPSASAPSVFDEPAHSPLGGGSS